MKNTAPLVDIVLGTFNGGEYLLDFLSSLEAQTFKNWRLIARDDGSIDDSVVILSTWASRIENEVLLINDDLGNVNVVRNYNICLMQTSANYVFFADQDDIWLDSKIANLLKEIKFLEKNKGKDFPVLCYCDLLIVDSNNNIMNDSYFKYKGYVRESGNEFEKILVENFVPGCSMVMNRALLNKALPIPDGALMHDWWVLLCAKYIGDVFFLPKGLIRYRQHGNNTIGANSNSFMKNSWRFLVGKKEYKKYIELIFRQASLIDGMTPLVIDKAMVLSNFLSIPNSGFLNRIFIILKFNFSKFNKLNNLFFILFLIFY